MKQVPENKKTLEGEEILKLLDNKQLQFLKDLKEQGYQQVIAILDMLAQRDKESIYYITKNQGSIDELIKSSQKQNFWSGRVSGYVLFDYLITHASQKLEERMDAKE